MVAVLLSYVNCKRTSEIKYLHKKRAMNSNSADPDSPALSKLQLRIGKLSLADQRSLHHWLGELIASHAATAALASITPRTGREVVAQRRLGRVTYQLELVRCGKPNCRCAVPGERPHGPYWYLYRWNGQKVVSEYVGKMLPDLVLHEELGV